MNVVERITELAMSAHNGVNRDGPGTVPYIVHPNAVVCMLRGWGYTESEDPVTLAVAWGHDVLEDTDMSESRIRDVCGELEDRIVNGLRLLTFKPTFPSGHPEYGRLKAAYIEHVAQTAPVEILPVKIADRLCNTLEFLHDGDAEHARAYLGYGEPLFGRVDELRFAEAIKQEIASVRDIVGRRIDDGGAKCIAYWERNLMR